MAESCFMSVLRDAQLLDRTEDTDYLQKVSNYVLCYKFEKRPLNDPPGAVWIIKSLEDTSYHDKQDEVEAWGKFYLPTVVDMKVIGVVEGTSCPYDELVLMTCEDENVYAYDGEELHLVATELKQLIDNEEMEYPASKTYYNGEAFEAMDEEQWKKVKNGAVGKRLDQEHKQMVEGHKEAFLRSLKSGAHS